MSLHYSDVRMFREEFKRVVEAIKRADKSDKLAAQKEDLIAQMRLANQLKLVELVGMYGATQVQKALEGVTVRPDGTFHIAEEKIVKPIPKAKPLMPSG